MQVIGLALVHSLWQGGIIAALLALAFSVTRTARPSVRYALGMIGLVAMVILPAVTAARSNIAIKPATARTTSSIVASPATQTSAMATTPAISGGVSMTPADVPAETTQANSSAESFLTKLEPSLPWLVVAWLIGLIFLSARMITGVARTRRIVRDGRPSSERLAETVSRIANALGLHRAVKALQGTHVTVPMVIGWIRPVLVVPASLVTGLTPSQLDMLVAHELAHIRRYDYLANMAQTVIETLLFFHPGVWWLSDRIREERENCCDDIALAVCGNDRKAYTQALLSLEESRDDGFTFAAAATGRGDRGSLLRRAMRLLSGGPAHLDLGARWIAGVITIFAALFTTGPAVGKAADIPIASKLDVIGMLTSESDSVEHGKYASDASRSAPDTVLIYGGRGSFTERWRWAVDRAGSLRSNRYWIGYLVAGDPTSQLVYQDNDVPIRAGNSYIKGRMKMMDADNVIFTGSLLPPLFGAHSSHSTAIFLQFERSFGNDKLTRVHLGSYAIPVYFDKAPAIWIDSTSDAESISKLRALALSERSIDTRRDLISIISMHRDVTAMLPPLVELADSQNEPESIRREAVEGIGEISDPRALAVLARIARRDRSTEIRKEAVEGFQNMRLDAATDTLIAFATTLEDSRLRRKAIESLGEREDERTVAFLKRLATSGNDYGERAEAVEALGNMHELGLSAVVDLARNAADISVRRKAVETLAEFHDSRAKATLASLVHESSDISVQVEATEALGETVDTENDVKALVSLAQSHPRTEVRRKAIESLGNTHSSAAFEAIKSIALTDPSEDSRHKAIETYTESVTTNVAVPFLKEIVLNDRSERIRYKGLEMLGELDSGAGVPALRELARSSPDATIRRKAEEILTER
jgi:HEAT repeat protein/beta-lactamase regulating signal transducer with metallopeptidase domain